MAKELSRSDGESERVTLTRQIKLLNLAEGFFESRILFALVKLKIFESLGQEEKSLESLASAVNGNSETLVRLLNAGVILGLLESSDGATFRTHRDWQPILTEPVSENYLGNWIGFLDYLSFTLQNLDQAAVAGGPTQNLLMSKNRQDIREFTLAMHNYAAVRGKELVHYLDLSGCRTLLDLGCGPGTYAFHLGVHNPSLELNLLDLPEILEVTREVQARYPLKNKIRYHPVDVTKEEIPGTYDLVMISNMLHMLGETESRKLLKRLLGGVAPGGSLVVQFQYMNDDRRGGRWPILLDLIQLCITENGRNHAVPETRQWMIDAGFEGIEFSPMSVFNTNGFLRGYRPNSES